MYRVTIDTDACQGIFACLVRDERFVESAEGLATFDAGDVDGIQSGDSDAGEIVAEFDDDRRADAEQAAAACPPSAITVEEVDSEAASPEATGSEGVDSEVVRQ